MRCLNLAATLYEHEFDIFFLTKKYSQNLISKIPNNYHVIELEGTILESEFIDNDYSTWNMEREEDEFKRVSDIVSKNNISHLVLDHYGINKVFDELVMSQLDLTYLVVDDLCFAHKCHLLINQNFGFTADQYKDSEVDKLLLGPTFSMISRVYKDLPKRDRINEINNILVFFGVSDKTNENMKLVDAIVDLDFNEEKHRFQFIIPESHQDRERIKNKLKDFPNIKIDPLLENFPEVLSTSDLMIGGSGSINWERFCLGIPGVVVTISDNQNQLTQMLHLEDLIYLVGEGNKTSKENWKSFLKETLPNIELFQKISANSLRIDCGDGTEKIVEAFLEVR